ncbi:MAG: helix-turn-helix transcriptional regulator, partial [Clostridiales bacterium]|nr:helix-turn-helix transcriptional regulator [Clostridiales bacterium]
IRNITEELVGEKHAGFVTEAGGMAVCLVNLSADQGKLPDEAKTMEEMLEIANRVDGLVSSILGVQLSIAVSGLQHSVRNIEKAYSQAVQVLEYKELTGFSESAADFSMIMPAKGRNEFITTHDKEKKFYNFVTAGDFLSAGSVLNDMITNDLTRSGNSLQLVKCRLFGILNSMINAIGEIRNSIDLEIFDELDPINRLLAAKSIVELKDEVNLIFSQINDCHKNKGDGQMYGKADEIVDYVRRNCFSPDLSISKIADVFQMSQPSVSRIFKKKTGNVIVEYIHELRVNKVKELMKSTDHSLKVIAGEVGFTNSVTLIRAFKKSEGIAPGKFRAIC